MTFLAFRTAVVTPGRLGFNYFSPVDIEGIGGLAQDGYSGYQDLQDGDVDDGILVDTPGGGRAMSETFEVVTGAIGKEAAAEVLASAGRLETRIGQLQAYLAPMAGTWSGAAAEAYDGVQHAGTSAQRRSSRCSARWRKASVSWR